MLYLELKLMIPILELYMLKQKVRLDTQTNEIKRQKEIKCKDRRKIKYK